MISFSKRILWFSILVFASTSAAFAQSTFLQVAATPYDRQIGRIDPTFNWTAAMKVNDPQNYIAFYGYEGARKYRAANSLLANRIHGTRSLAAPSQGAITRPTRSTWRAGSNPRFFEDGSTSPRSFS